MARTDAPSCQALMAPGYDYDTVNTPSLTMFINTANRITTAWLAAITRYRPDQTAPDAAAAADMETWLACWLFKLSDQQYSSKNSGRASAQFRGMSEKGLRMNTYGEGAIALDAVYGRVLVPLLEGRIAGTDWLGKVPSEQIPYEERN